MKIGPSIAIAAAKPRPYRQRVRAAAAAATGRRILDAFIGLMRERWLEDVTLDEVARAAGVTVQTVVRRFGGKDGLLAAADAHLQQEITARRATPPGVVERAIPALVADYEVTGDLVVRLLAQEPRHPALSGLLGRGRAFHRAWVAGVFAPWLGPLPPPARERRLAALIVITDVYTWKLLRRDMGLAPAEVAALLREMAAGLLGGAAGA
jgi:AcrR family transcriptional regulator